MNKLFRYIVAISTVLFIVTWFLPYYDYMWLTEEELNLANANMANSYIPNTATFFWVQSIIWVAVSIGLFLYIPIARTAFLILMVLSFIAVFFSGFYVMPPLQAGINSIIGLSDGVILSMAYLTSVAKCFEKNT